jgi:hypothetical protein
VVKRPPARYAKADSEPRLPRRLSGPARSVHNSRSINSFASPFTPLNEAQGSDRFDRWDLDQANGEGIGCPSLFAWKHAVTPESSTLRPAHLGSSAASRAEGWPRARRRAAYDRSAHQKLASYTESRGDYGLPRYEACGHAFGGKAGAYQKPGSLTGPAKLGSVRDAAQFVW